MSILPGPDHPELIAHFSVSAWFGSDLSKVRIIQSDQLIYLINSVYLEGLCFRFSPEIKQENKMMDTSTESDESSSSKLEIDMEAEPDTSSSSKVGHVQYR